MKRALRCSREGLDDLKALAAWVAADDPAVARRLVDALRDVAQALAVMPTGRPGGVPGTYEKSVARLPYVVAYSIVPDGEGEVLAILRVIHTARDWPVGGWPT